MSADGIAAPAAAGPLTVKALILSLLLATGVQAWQIIHPVPPELAGAAYASEPPTFIVNVTSPGQPEPSTEPVTDPPVPEDPPEPPPPPPPAPTIEKRIENPKYREDIDFEWEVLVSSTPLVYTPWSGNGPPLVLAYFKGLNDTGMLLNAYASLQGMTGYDLCDNPIQRFWNWTVVQAGAVSDRLVYESNPLPDNPYNLMGSGENCYTRVSAQSEWKFEVCLEGDGAILKPRKETLPDQSVVIEYLDFMDFCSVQILKIN